MPQSLTRIGVRRLCAAFLGMALMQPAAQAAVSGSYQGVIDQDGGLGLIGQTMRMDFVYDETVAPTSVFSSSAFFYDVVSAFTVQIGGSSWTWDPNGFSSSYVYNDYVASFAVGAQDTFSLSGSTFNGPSLVADPVAAGSYEATIYLIDTLPASTPDALSSHTALPVAAPDPGLFRVAGPGGTEADDNYLQFRFYVGDGEINTTHYNIRAISVSPVPEPSAALMILAGLGILGVAGHVRGHRRS